MSYLPDNYQQPKQGSGDYLIIKEPQECKVRLLTKPTILYEAWTNDNKPVRKTTGENWELGDFKDTPRECWAFIVWNYEEKKFQVFSTTKRGFINDIYRFVQDEDWGEPTRYDIKLIRKGRTMEDTEYSITPLPHKDLDAEIQKDFDSLTYDLDVLVDGGHPLQADKKKVEPRTEEIVSEPKDQTSDFPF